MQRETPLEFVDPGADERRRQDAVSYRAFLDYRLADGQLFGVSVRGLRVEKSIDQPEGRRSQALTRDGAGIYWQYTGLSDYELNLGLRADRLRNTLREPDGGKDYRIATPLAYGVLTHWFTPRQGWEVGTYVGRTWERTTLRPAGERFLESSNQDKLRTSWEYRALDGRSRLMLHFSCNLDDLARDPGDGAGMTYQGVL